MHVIIKAQITEEVNYQFARRILHVASTGLHPGYATELFRTTFGITIMDYLSQQRVAHAQRLLATTDQSVLEVAMEAGFTSASRFYATFQKITGLSPRAYRSSLLP